MKKLFTLGLLLTTFFSYQLDAQRYLSEVFTDVTVEKGIIYARNYTVLTVSVPGVERPTPQELTFDFYSPTGDSETSRPLIILFPTGNFLPIGTNGTTSGTKEDFPPVEIANRLAKMGYVVAVAEYRQGWNPISPSRNERVTTLINAAYRGIQDARSCVRFFRANALDGGNTYGICPDRISYWGVGTGGYVATAAAAIDNYQELILPKFTDSTGTFPMVIENFAGNPDGTAVALAPPGSPPGFDTLSLPNTPNYNSDVQLSVNMGGAIGDTSWISADDPAFISFHTPRDPFAPYKEAILTVPTTGDLIVEVQGSYLINQKAKELGLNAKFENLGLTDAYTTSANSLNDGLEGLFPFARPEWPNPFNPAAPPYFEGSPWDWWDSAFWATQEHPSCVALSLPLSVCNFDVIARLNNRDASETKGKTYIDSIIGYFAPRAYAQLDLEDDIFCTPLAVDELLATDYVDLKISPNPASANMLFTSSLETPMQTIEIFDLSGRVISSFNVNDSRFTLDRDQLTSGMYVAKVRFAEGIVAKKVVFN